MQVENYNGKNIPNRVYLDGKPFIGEAVFINGYNGYTSTNDDGFLAVLCNHSAFHNGKARALTDSNNKVIKSTDRRSSVLSFGCFGIIKNKR
jgi:hypothetical protein